MSAIAVNDLSAGYGRPAFSGVSFKVEPGEFVGLLGPNGAGKSTLLKVLSGAIAPMAGNVELAGLELGRYKAQALGRKLAHLPQHPPDDRDFTVREVVAFGRHPHHGAWGWGDEERDREVVQEAMAAVAVSDWANRRMGSLSGGEQQRVRLAQALAQEPEVLLLDEPTAWADLRFQLDLLKRVSDLARTRRIAAVAVLHDLNHAAQFCSRLLLLHHGRLAQDGAPHETLTPSAILDAFGVPVLVQRHPETGAPYVLPRLTEA
ncbi:ABC transporter ATP-binding protein [bacterium]|nr:ABC transporter ATP-binding protein [bacterium]